MDERIKFVPINRLMRNLLLISFNALILTPMWISLPSCVEIGKSDSSSISYVTTCCCRSSNSRCSQSRAALDYIEIDQQACESPPGGFIPGGVFTENACPTENRVGICDQDEADNDLHYYSNGSIPWDATTAEADCKGIFTAE